MLLSFDDDTTLFSVVDNKYAPLLGLNTYLIEISSWFYQGRYVLVKDK